MNKASNVKRVCLWRELAEGSYASVCQFKAINDIIGRVDDQYSYADEVLSCLEEIERLVADMRQSAMRLRDKVHFPISGID